MIATLEKLFGSAAKVKIMRLFLFNPSTAFDIADVSRRSDVSAITVRKEIQTMQKIGLIKKKNYIKERVRGRGKKKKISKIKAVGFTIDSSFEYKEPLQSLLMFISSLQNEQILKRISRVGKLKLIVVAGFFIQNPESRIDLLVVGDGIKKNKLESIINGMEAEIGREIRYASFETADFKYRMGMYDKLVRDILDYPHEKILDKLLLSKNDSQN